VKKIVLNAPKGNVLEAAMLREIGEALDSMANDSDIKLIVFEGEGKHFSFGASVPEHTKEKAGMMLDVFHGVFYKLVALAVPTMAVVRGQCLGGGMELALFCNFIVADQSAMFGQPEIILGVFPPPASVMLPLKVGQSYADDLILSGRSINAVEGYRIGLVNVLATEGEDAWVAAENWITKNLLPKSASSLKIANKAGRMRFFDMVRSELPKMENLYLKELMETEDANEGIGAYLEKRQAVWKNK
jgi:cyclohexa-1,5-dienecarbonyl-CoA hydratase